MNTVVSSWQSMSRALIKKKSVENGGDEHIGEAAISDFDDEKTLNAENSNEKLFLPYIGNGFIGLSANSKLGLFASHMKSLSLRVMYNPLASIYIDNLERKGFNTAFFYEI